MKFAASTPAFDHALSVEIAASEQIRMRVLAGALAIRFLGDQLLFLFARETLEQFAGRLLPTWLPLKVFGLFLAYEILALVVLRYRRGAARACRQPRGSPTRSSRPAYRRSFCGG
jgi:hypothetical protein